MKSLLFLILAVFVSGCSIEGSLVSEKGAVYLETDKGLYHSGEIIKINSVINSSSAFNDVKVRFYGIYAGRYRLDSNKTVDLIEGKNNITFDYKAPNCYGCSGIKPGTYSINVDVIYNNSTIGSKSIDIEIRQ